MNQKIKEFALAKKEIAFVFFFMVVLSLVFFGLGLKVGKKLIVQTVPTQENPEPVVTHNPPAEKEVIPVPTTVSVDKKTYEEMEQELKTLKEARKIIPETKNISQEISTKQSSYLRPIHSDTSGKYTVQLGNPMKTFEDAKEFADGISVRGYDPIIRELRDEEGVKYRVSLGTFPSPETARRYVEKDSSLFQNQDYQILQMD